MNDVDRELARDITGATAAHRRLEADLAGLTDDDMHAPSLLPGWSRGHVLTHIARNAESLTGMLLAAGRGDRAVQYPGGRAQRNGDIEAGSVRSAADIAAHVRDEHARLEAAFAATPSEVWVLQGETVAGPVAMRELPFRRWRETMVHHADLGLAYSWEDWPAEYVRVELSIWTMQWDSRKPMGLTGLPAAALAVSPNRRLAWMFGRAEIDGLAPAELMP